MQRSPAQPVPAPGEARRSVRSARSPTDPAPHDADSWLVGDIGGTYARFRRLAAHDTPAEPIRLANDDFTDLAHVLHTALARAGPGVSRIALAVASPVDDGPIRLTNRDWRFDAASLRQAAGAAEVRLVNDFAAAAAGLAVLGPHELAAVAGAQLAAVAGAQPAAGTTEDCRDRRQAPRGSGVRIVLGPGTGLGMAAAIRCGPHWRILESEAGHVGCATLDADTLPALAAARWRWGRASWERLLSGDGLARLDAGLRGTPVRAPAAVAADARAGEAIAHRAAGAFSRLLGEFAGDVCLTLLADAVYLTGGVLDGLGEAFDVQAFRRGFEDKGRFAQRMRETPAWRVLAGDLALRGLAQVIAGAAEVRSAVDPPARADEG